MKKQFLTLALLATVAIGGAFASSIAQTVIAKAGPYNNNPPGTPNNCTKEVPCSPTVTPNVCTIDGITYFGNTDQIGATGECIVPLYLDEVKP